MPGTNPSTPTSRKTADTAMAAVCTVLPAGASEWEWVATVISFGWVVARDCLLVWSLTSAGHTALQPLAYLAGTLLLTGEGAHDDEGAGQRGHGPLQHRQLTLGGGDVGGRRGRGFGAGLGRHA